jgi:hypothetical protein
MEPFPKGALERVIVTRFVANEGVLAVADTAIGLAVVLSPLGLAIVVLLLIELTDRIPFPEASDQDHDPGAEPFYGQAPTPLWKFYAGPRHKPRRGRMTPQK